MKDVSNDSSEGSTPLSREERKGLKINSITTRGELNEAEQENITQAKIWLSRYRKNDYLSLPFIKKLHKKMFGNVWKWAGEFRQSDKNIGVEKWQISVELKKLVEDTFFWIQNKTYDWKELAARFHHRLTLIHPFPNGNGRFSREITEFHLKKCNQEIPNWGTEMNPKKRRKIYLSSLRKADNSKNFDNLIEFMWN
jgi:Fic-DOC domain mobile mystery protein B